MKVKLMVDRKITKGKMFKDSKNEYKTLRLWQKEAWDELINEQYCVIEATTGSGKTTCERALTLTNLLNNPGSKNIVVVPQEIISKGFKKIRLDLGNGKTVSYDVVHNLDLCKGNEKDKAKFLKAFLKTEIPNYIPLSHRVLITTHQTLVNAYKSGISLDLFENVYLTIDEGHHLTIGNNLSNGLGSFVKDIIDFDKSYITLMSATMLRGDKLSVLGEYAKKFKTYRLGLDKYLKSCRYIKRIKIGVVLYDADKPEDILNEIEKQFGKKKTIAFLPYVNSYPMIAGNQLTSFLRDT